MPAEGSRKGPGGPPVAGAICRRVRMGTRRVYHLRTISIQYQHFQIDSDSGLKALRLQAVNAHLDPAQIRLCCHQDKHLDGRFIAIDRTITAPDATVDLQTIIAASFPTFFFSSFGDFASPCSLLETDLLARLQLNWARRPSRLAEGSRECFLHPAHSWWISGHYCLLLQSLCYRPVSTNIYAHATSISSLLLHNDDAAVLYSTERHIYSTRWY